MGCVRVFYSGNMAAAIVVVHFASLRHLRDWWVELRKTEKDYLDEMADSIIIWSLLCLRKQELSNKENEFGASTLSI